MIASKGTTALICNCDENHLNSSWDEMPMTRDSLKARIAKKTMTVQWIPNQVVCGLEYSM